MSSYATPEVSRYNIHYIHVESKYETIRNSRIVKSVTILAEAAPENVQLENIKNSPFYVNLSDFRGSR